MTSAALNPLLRAGDGEARRHPLHVVLERPGQGLVEIVEVEQQSPLGRGERAEVREVRVAAQLDVQAGRGGVLEVGRHDLRAPSVEGERRRHHPTVADGYQIRFTGQVLCFEQRHRVRAIRCRYPSAVAGERCRSRAPLPLARRSSTLGWATLVMTMVPTPLFTVGESIHPRPAHSIHGLKENAQPDGKGGPD